MIEGVCYRLYTERAFELLSEQSIPEIQRVDITHVILELLSLGIENPLGFPFLSAPSKSTLKKGLLKLVRLGAIDSV
jgi:HrpA-like RNA helicase